jgi:hypothetical protein
MKYKFPQVLCYQDWEDLYSLPNNPEHKGFLFKHVFEYPETAEMKKVRLDVLQLLEKNKKAILEVEVKMVEYMQLDTIKNPAVYIAVLKDTRNPEFENVTAKTFWPLVGGGRKEIRIYIGRLTEFKNIKRDDISSEKSIKDKAVQMMKKHLTSKYNLGQLPLFPRIPAAVLKNQNNDQE